MFRSLFRRPRKVKVPTDGGTIGFQRVEVTAKKRGPEFTKFVLQTFLFYCAYRTAVLWIYGPDPEVQKRIEEIQKKQKDAKTQPKPSSHWQEQHDAFANAKALGTGEAARDKKKPSDESTEDAITIPVPGWIKMLPRTAYDPTDPEMKAFELVKQDSKATKRLYTEFDAAINQHIKNNKQHLVALKFIDFKGTIGRTLHFEPLFFRPPTFAIRCIVIKPTGYELVWREMEPESGARMQKMLHPYVLSRAFLEGSWAFTTTTAALARAKAMDILFPAKTFTFVHEKKQLRSWMITYSFQEWTSKSYEDKVIEALPYSKYTDAQAKKRFPFLKGDHEKDSNEDNFRNQVQSVTHEHALQHAVGMFKARWTNGQLKAQRASTPGAVSVMGYYDYIGAKGRYRIEVYGRYLPGDDVLIGPPQILRGHILTDMAKDPAEKRMVLEAPGQHRKGVERAPQRPVAAPGKANDESSDKAEDDVKQTPKDNPAPKEAEKKAEK